MYDELWRVDCDELVMLRVDWQPRETTRSRQPYTR